MAAIAGAQPADEKVYESGERGELTEGRIEKAIRLYYSGQYEQAKALNSDRRDNVVRFRAAANGEILRDPSDPSPYAQMYIPFGQQYLRDRGALIAQRTIPDEQRMDFFSVESGDSLDPATAMKIALEFNLPMDTPPPPPMMPPMGMGGGMDMGMSGMPPAMPPGMGAPPTMPPMGGMGMGMGMPAMAAGYVDKTVTLALRDLVRNSNLAEVYPRMCVNTPTYGDTIAIPVQRTRVEYLRADDLISSEAYSDMFKIGPNGAIEYQGDDGIRVVDEETDEESVLIPHEVFDRVEIIMPDMGNVLATDTNNEGGLTALPNIFIFQRKSFRDLWGDCLYLRKTDVGYNVRVNGSHPRENLLTIRPEDAMEVPDLLDDLEGGTLGYEWGAFGGPDNLTTAMDDKYFRVPCCIGELDIEKMDTFRNDPPTDAEVKEFCDKFGVSSMEWNTSQCWVVEWCVERDVLLTCRPWPYPLNPANNKPFVHCRYITVPGRTFGYSIYQDGLFDQEIIANNALQNMNELADRTSRPMMWLRMADLEKEQRETLGTTLRFRPYMVYKINAGASNAPFGEILPNPVAIQTAESAFDLAQNQMQRMVGYSPDLLSATGGGDTTATETATARNYFEQGLFANQRRDETFILRPILGMILLQLLRIVSDEGEFSFTATPEDMGIFGSGYGAKSRRLTITPEMLDRDYRFNIVTTGAQGDREGMLNRMERGFQMAVSNLMPLAAEGTKFNLGVFMSDYFERNNLPASRYFTVGDPMAAMAQAQAAAGGGGEKSDGGNQSAEQMAPSAPGEPYSGMPVDQGQIDLSQIPNAGGYAGDMLT